MDHSVWLVEICSSSDVWGDYSVMLASMCHAIHLDRQKDWNPALFKIARKLDHG